MINLPAKILLGVGSAGAVGLGGYGIYSLASTTTIEQKLNAEKLNAEKLILLSTDLVVTSDDAEWEKKVKELEGTSLDPALSGYVKKTNTDETQQKAENVKQIKEICKGLLKFDSKDESKLKQARKWCTKSVETSRE